MKTKKVSIILPSYNHAPFLEKRLDSIISQTYQDFQFIIIDDCSTDSSVSILEKFRNTYPHLIKHFIINPQNSGSGYKSWKKGIELADTPYIWVAETDDYSEPQFLERTVASLDANPHMALVFCGNNVVDENDFIFSNSDRRTVRLNVPAGELGIFPKETFLENMPFKTFITNGSSVVFRKPQIPLPEEFFNYRQMTDGFIWTYLLENQSFGFINEKLNSFRKHQGATTIRMYHRHLKEVFLEKADYVHYFDIQGKFSEFIDEYLRLYVWHNKSKSFDFEVVDKFNNQPYRRYHYLRKWLGYFISRSLQRIFK